MDLNQQQNWNRIWQNFHTQLEPNTEYVMVVRSGEHGRGDNNNGYSITFYERYDFI